MSDSSPNAAATPRGMVNSHNNCYLISAINAVQAVSSWREAMLRCGSVKLKSVLRGLQARVSQPVPGSAIDRIAKEIFKKQNEVGAQMDSTECLLRILFDTMARCEEAEAPPEILGIYNESRVVVQERLKQDTHHKPPEGVKKLHRIPNLYQQDNHHLQETVVRKTAQLTIPVTRPGDLDILGHMRAPAYSEVEENSRLQYEVTVLTEYLSEEAARKLAEIMKTTALQNGNKRFHIAGDFGDPQALLAFNPGKKKFRYPNNTTVLKGFNDNEGRPLALPHGCILENPPSAGFSLGVTLSAPNTGGPSVCKSEVIDHGEILMVELSRRGSYDHSYKIMADVRPPVDFEGLNGRKMRLHVVIYHHGITWSSGHYSTTFFDDLTQQYFHCDDENVVRVAGHTPPPAGATPILLIYRQTNPGPDAPNTTSLATPEIENLSGESEKKSNQKSRAVPPVTEPPSKDNRTTTTNAKPKNSKPPAPNLKKPSKVGLNRGSNAARNTDSKPSGLQNQNASNNGNCSPSSGTNSEITGLDGEKREQLKQITSKSNEKFSRLTGDASDSNNTKTNTSFFPTVIKPPVPRCNSTSSSKPPQHGPSKFNGDRNDTAPLDPSSNPGAFAPSGAFSSYLLPRKSGDTAARLTSKSTSDAMFCESVFSEAQRFRGQVRVTVTVLTNLVWKNLEIVNLR